jgi:hypothetical protein
MPRLALAAILLAGTAGRFRAAVGDFPVNDGGLFYVMVVELMRADFALPDSIPFNAYAVPIAYPPLAFYFTAAIAWVTGAPVDTLLRVIPPLMSAATILAVFRLASVLAMPRPAALFATFAFACAARGFSWTVMGGGVTRAPGYLFALLAAAEILRVAQSPSKRRILVAAGLCALTVVTHPEATLVLGALGAVVLVCSYNNRAGLLGLVAVALVALLFTAPWLIAMVARHGLTPFGGAGSTAFPVSHIVRLAGLPFVSPVGSFAAIGLLVCWKRGNFLLPVWLLLIILLTGEFRTYIAAPLALLAATGIAALPSPLTADRRLQIAAVSVLTVACAIIGTGLYGPVARQLTELLGPAADRIVPKALGLIGDPRTYLAAALAMLAGGLLLTRQPQSLPASLRVPINMMLACLAVGMGVFATVTFDLGPTLSPSDRAAMAWIATDTAPDSRFLVMSGSPSWGLDPASEWFGALTSRVSIATPQGSEWVGARDEASMRYVTAQECGSAGSECLMAWSATNQEPFDYVFIPDTPAGGETARCCQTLMQSLLASSRFEVAYDRDGSTIFKRKPN